VNTKESLTLLSATLYSFIASFSVLEYIFVFPLLMVLFSEKRYFIKILKKLLLLNIFIGILVLFVYFQNSSNALELLIRTNLILLFNLTLFHKSQGYDIVRGLDDLGFPSKIVSVFYFTLNLISYLMKEFKEMKNTLKLRGFKNNTSLYSYQTYGNIFAMMFIKALKKSENIQFSMDARGFKNKIYFLHSSNVSSFDKILLGFIIIILAKVIYELFS